MTSNCQVVLSLAHLLQQHSLSYDTEKNALLQTSVKCASQLARGGGEVHIILTGSPRPTFAETNAWLLEGSAAAAGGGNNNNSGSSANNDTAMRDENDRPNQLKGSYSIADNVHHSGSNQYKEDEEMEDENKQSDLQTYIEEFTNDKQGSSGDADGSGGHNNSFIRRNTTGAPTNANNNASENARRRSTIDAGESSVSNNAGPMVGQAVVNAISKSSGVGLQCSRSKLLQGTIDRPLWSQNRWTDGECLFSELVELCGMDSFEMDKKKKNQQQKQGGPDDAAGGAAPSASPATPTNMSANLITVPATTLREPNAGVSQTTIDEISRGVLRTVKRKKSPPASKVYIVLPGGVSEDQRKEVVVTLLKQAWEKLEQYNHMIGQQNLLSEADLEFVDVV